MRSESFNTVRHDAVPLDRVRAAVEEWASELRLAHHEIVRVGYFGSYARGDYAPGSDLDVMIEVSEINLPRMADRAATYLPKCFPIGVDVLVYSSEELKRLADEGAAFVTTILLELRTLAKPLTDESRALSASTDSPAPPVPARC